MEIVDFIKSRIYPRVIHKQFISLILMKYTLGLRYRVKYYIKEVVD